MTEGLRGIAVQVAGRIVLSAAPGDTIREARTRYGFTQSWLAPHLDVRRESLSRIESGHSNPTLEVVERFARIMALVQHVREEAARRETGAARPSPSGFRSAGDRLGLDPETSDEIARQALESYTAKREALLEGLRKPNGGT